MFSLTSSKAIALAAIILGDVQGTPDLQKQLPLQVSDAGSNWLVKGQMFDDPSLNVQFCITHVFLAKNTAEVVGIGTDIRIKLDAAGEARFRKEFSEADFQAIFGPAKKFEPDGLQLELYDITKGGLINSKESALAYGYSLMESDRSTSLIPKEALKAFETSGVWHVEAVDRAGKSVDILSFSRATGKVLSFATQ